MELSFSRGFSPGWLDGCDHKMLVPALSSAKRGVLLGEVTGSARGRRARSRWPARSSAATAWSSRATARNPASRAASKAAASTRSSATAARSSEPVAEGVVELTFAHGTIRWNELRPGQKVWKTDDPRADASVAQDVHRRRSRAARVGRPAGRGRGGPAAGNLGPAPSPARLAASSRPSRSQQPASTRSPPRCSASSWAGSAAPPTHLRNLEAKIDGAADGSA